MDTKNIVDARKQAESAVADMPDGPLKIKAFEVILDKLLAGPNNNVQSSAASAPLQSSVPSDGEPPIKPRSATSSTERIEVLASEGVFQDLRGIGEVREALAAKGWHYPVTSLSGPMQTLVRRGVLRRMRTKNGWKYSLS